MLKLFQSNTYLIWVSMLVLVAVLQGVAISKDKVNPKHVASLSISQNFGMKQVKQAPPIVKSKQSAKMYAVSMARAVESQVKVDFVELESLKDIPDSPLTFLEEKKIPKLSESVPQFKEAKKVDVSTLVKKQPVTSPRYIYHQVERGETLVQIAKMYELNVNQLILYNDISDPDQIYPGFKLKVHFDPTFKHVVRDGDTLWSISRMYGVKGADIRKWNDFSGNSVRAGLGLNIKIKDVSQSNIQRILKVRKRKSRFIWPYRGRLTDKMGWRTHPITKVKNHHNGIDIAGPIGDGIYAVDGGKVVHARFSSVSGNLIIVKHSSGYTSRYAHCSKLFVKKGQTVRQGQKIAEIGDTGRVTGAHLHFELRKGKKVLDPLKYL